MEFIVCDGASTDKTLDIILNYSKKNKSIKVFSEKDNGMYEALSKGIKNISGNICAYINAGDFYYSHAFETVLDIMENDKCEWLTGLTTIANEKSQIIDIKFPFKYRSKFIKYGYYGNQILPFIQQESTFWKSSLNNSLDLEELSRLNYAGDYYIWSQLSKAAELKIIFSILGIFKRHENQLSENYGIYIKEINNFKKKSQIAHVFNIPLIIYDKVIFKMPPKIKKILNNRGIYIFNYNLKRWE